MATDQTFEHYGQASRLGSGEIVQVSGHFRVIETRSVNGVRRQVIEDARVGTPDFEGVKPENHRYMLPGDFTTPTPIPPPE